VVGHAVDQDGSAAGTIAFITDLFEVVAIGSARAALNGALDVVLGHVGRGGLVPCQAQTRVGVRVGAAGACRNGDFTDDLGPELAALGVLTPFAVLDVCPFTVSGHICSTKSESWEFYPQASPHHMKTRQTPFRGAFFCAERGENEGRAGSGDALRRRIGSHPLSGAWMTLAAMVSNFVAGGETMAAPIKLAQGPASTAVLLPRYANRHGCITGATGTGKTVTLQVMAEAFSRLGTPVFVSDVKGDLSGISQPGQPTLKLMERLQRL